MADCLLSDDFKPVLLASSVSLSQRGGENHSLCQSAANAEEKQKYSFKPRSQHWPLKPNSTVQRTKMCCEEIASPVFTDQNKRAVCKKSEKSEYF